MKGFCYIVGAGEFFETEAFRLEEDDFLIAADGGLRHLPDGQRPDLLIGDFDSLPDENTFDGEIIRLPRVKDHTDMLESISEGLRRGYRNFLLFGATGGRISHTLSNIQCLSFLREKGGRGWIFDQSSVLTLIRDETVVFPESFRGYFSVFSLSDQAVVTEKGFAYNIEREQLRNSYPLGVSNEFTGAPSEIRVQSGDVLIIYERRNLKSFTEVR